MKGKTLKEVLLYSYRYIFAYGIIALFIGYFLFWQIGSVGPGLSRPELHSAAVHTNARATLREPIYPLFSKLQVFSLKIFGISTYSIRIPSLLIATATLLLLYQVLKKWFGKPTALLSTALIATADWFLFTARLASGNIELSFWLIVALYSVTKILEHKNIFTFALVSAITALLFVPFGPYLAVCLSIGIFTCRLIRDRILEASAARQVLLVAIPVLGLLYLGYTLFYAPTLAKTLLGIDFGLPTPSMYIKSLLVNGSSVVAVLPATDPLNGPTGVFFVRFFELIFVLFGVFMLWKTRINRLNLIVIACAITLFLVSGLSQSNAASSLLIVPCAIFITAGLRYFIHRWQKTFPRNPYARLAAIVPVITLLLLTALLHQQSYFALWAHQPQVSNVFNYDLQLAQSELNSNTTAKSCTVISTDPDIVLLLKASSLSCKPNIETGIDANLRRPLKDELILVQASLLPNFKNPPGVQSRALAQASTQQPVRWLAQTSSTSK